MLPEGWARRPLGEVADVMTGFAFSSEGYQSEDQLSETIRLLRGDNVMQGRIDWEGARRWPAEAASVLERFQLRMGDVVLALDRPVTKAGLKCAEVRQDDLPCLLVQRVARIRATVGLDQGYVSQVISTERFANHLVGSKTETAVPHVSPSDVRAFEVPVPPIDEQRLIARILSSWDEAIATTEQLLANGRKQKQALMHTLLMGRARRPGYAVSSQYATTKIGRVPEDWKHVRIGELAKEISQKNGEDHALPVLSCTKHEGLVDSLTYFKKRVFSADTSTYKLVPKGCFAYATNHIDEGSIGYQSLYDRALISPMYTVFSVGEQVDHGFLFKLLKTDHYRQVFAANTNASVDRRGGLRWSDFKKIEIPLPSIPEQRAISEVIDAAEEEVRGRAAQVEALQKEKRSLMADLLTGRRRVRLPSAENTP